MENNTKIPKAHLSWCAQMIQVVKWGPVVVASSAKKAIYRKYPMINTKPKMEMKCVEIFAADEITFRI